ncbi:hypothetical protein EDC90_101271 [Martelella mediterranea]|uniref:Uncharacterized protein n=1 Tax=Martelella mediterranea TaxID=293089 RepID=A0A4R3NTA8_9HYPH|nr:hypothetical protein EDC90_101271 [Martelella mediterranea]
MGVDFLFGPGAEGLGENLALNKTSRVVHMRLPVTSICCNPCPSCIVDNSGDFAAKTDDTIILQLACHTAGGAQG